MTVVKLCHEEGPGPRLPDWPSEAEVALTGPPLTLGLLARARARSLLWFHSMVRAVIGKHGPNTNPALVPVR